MADFLHEFVFFSPIYFEKTVRIEIGLHLDG